MGMHSPCAMCHFIAEKLHIKVGAKPSLKLLNSETIHSFSHSCVLCLALWINWYLAGCWLPTASLMGKGTEYVPCCHQVSLLCCVVLSQHPIINSILLVPFWQQLRPLFVAKPLLPASVFIQWDVVRVNFLWQIQPLILCIPHWGGKDASTSKGASIVRYLRFFLSADFFQALNDTTAASWVAC